MIIYGVTGLLLRLLRRTNLMNIFEALTKHHGTMRELFDKTTSYSSVFQELKNHLQVHHKNEEKILYDVLKTKEPTRKDAIEAVEEHHVIEFLLFELENFPRDHERWAIKLEVLEEYTKHHLKEEETEVFPEGAKVLSTSEAEEMAVRFEAIKEKQLAVL
jgi:hemerythrin-like domain-containing protein